MEILTHYVVPPQFIIPSDYTQYSKYFLSLKN